MNSDAIDDGQASKGKGCACSRAVAGVQMMRQSIGLTALSRTSPDELRDLLAPLFDQLLAQR